ncbi:hypothetical protein KM043_008140 [Ampulex compressa]|nr:hypothetical protein KM043_008140 [Ampulex compressa]
MVARCPTPPPLPDKKESDPRLYEGAGGYAQHCTRRVQLGIRETEAVNNGLWSPVLTTIYRSTNPLAVNPSATVLSVVLRTRNLGIRIEGSTRSLCALPRESGLRSSRGAHATCESALPSFFFYLSASTWAESPPSDDGFASPKKRLNAMEDNELGDGSVDARRTICKFDGTNDLYRSLHIPSSGTPAPSSPANGTKVHTRTGTARELIYEYIPDFVETRVSNAQKGFLGKGVESSGVKVYPIAA